jgi:uridine kinase
MPNPSITELVTLIRETPPNCGDTRVVLIDGQAGAGKSTLTNRLADALGGKPSEGAGTFLPDSELTEADTVQIVHGDDLYEGWGGLSTLDDVLLGSVLEPLAEGGVGSFEMWDWVAGRRSYTIRVPQRPFLIVEGVGVALPRARELAVLTVFVEAPWETRLARGVERDEHAYSDVVQLWERFEQDEQSHHARTRARENSHVVVDGTAPVPD